MFDELKQRLADKFQIDINQFEINNECCELVYELRHPELYHSISIDDDECYCIAHYKTIYGTRMRLDGTGEPDDEEYVEDLLIDDNIDVVFSKFVELEEKYNEDTNLMFLEEQKLFEETPFGELLDGE